MDDLLLVTTVGGVRTLTLNRPAARNALTRALMQRLAEELDAAEDDADVAAIILTGADPAFSAGLDLIEVGEVGLDPALLSDPAKSPWLKLRALRTPCIGAVNGACVTGGLELALHCSFLIASEKARFADTHARVGLHPGGGMTALLPQAVGIRQAKQMSFTGRFVGAAEALTLGLVNEVVPHDQLLPRAFEVAGEIAAGVARAVAAMNETYRDVAETNLADGQALELARCLDWKVEPGEVEARRSAVIERGRRS